MYPIVDFPMLCYILHKAQVLTATLDDRTLLSEANRHEKVSNTQSEPQNGEDGVT